MDDQYLESCITRSDHQILGRSMHPFCLRDLLNLIAIGSPCLSSQREITIGDLQQAGWLCSNDPFRAGATPSSYTGTRKTEYETFILNTMEWPLRPHLARWNDYLEDFWTKPEQWEETDGNGREVTGPWVLYVSTMLMHRTSLTYREVWTMPIGELMWIKAQLEEIVGGVQFQTPEEKAEMARLKAEQAAEKEASNG